MATLFLPPVLRRDVRLVYRFCRTVDDLVDEPAGMAPHDIIEVLNRWERALAVPGEDDPVLADVQRIIHEYALSHEYFVMLLRGARMDLTVTHLTTWEELRLYSLLVAGSVGMVLSEMLGARHEVALEAARDLGIAMQLTNILRDVAEDLGRGRIYLPQEVLAAARCSVESLRSGTLSPAFRSVMRDVADEARRRYRSGFAGIQYLDPSARLSVFIAATLYSRILDKIEGRNYDVFSERAHLGTVEKWTAIAPLYLRFRYSSAGGRSD